MSKVTVLDTIDEYLELYDQKGFIYIDHVWDKAKLKTMRNKAREIFRFPGNETVLNESIYLRGEGEIIRSTLRDSISKMQRKSNDEYLIANDYFQFLIQHYRVKIDPLDRQLTSLERQLSIAKDMHDFNKARNFDRNEVAQKYMVSEKTVENDMKALREGISVMDQRIVLSEIQLRNRKVTAVSTMHPIFLAQNLTQVICILEGLHSMEQSWIMASYARNTSVSIWRQLSDYARKRITGTLVDLMELDAGWYESLDEETATRPAVMFYNEKESSDRFGLLMYAMKGSLPCSICYVSEDDSFNEITGIITGIHDTTVCIRSESEENEKKIEKKRILDVEVATQLR